VDQVSEMQVDLEKNINVQPIIFAEEERESYIAKHRVDESDLILQIFPKRVIQYTGARVAKAIADTIGEAGMSKIHIEEIQDKLLDENKAVVFVKCSGFGTDYYQKMIFQNLFENLQVCLSATQA